MIRFQVRHLLHHHQLSLMERRSGRLKRYLIAATSTTDSNILLSGRAMMHLPGNNPATWKMPKSQDENFTSYGQIGLDLMGSPELTAKDGATDTAMTFKLLWMLKAVRGCGIILVEMICVSVTQVTG